MRVTIVIPTYNERENISRLIPEIQRVLKDYGMKDSTTILIVDDNSPDGTGKLAEEMSKSYGNIQVLHRPGKLGLGSAYKEGFSHAIKKGSDVIIQMDADLSHDPKYIPILLEGLQEGYDVVVGSRRVKGGGVVNWPLYRKLVSWVGNKMAAWLCGVKLRDSTSGYRAFKREALEKVDYKNLKSEGYAFQIEMLFQCQRMGVKIGEKPIIFVDRRVGRSKLSFKEWLSFTKTCMRLLSKRLRLAD